MDKQITKTPIKKKHNIKIIDDVSNEQTGCDQDNNIEKCIPEQNGGYTNTKKKAGNSHDPEKQKTKSGKDSDDELSDSDSDNTNEKDEQEEGQDDEQQATEADDKCFYKFAFGKTNEASADDVEDDVDSDVEDETLIEDDTKDIKHEKSKLVPSDERITKPVLTKYERVRLLGDRSKQLSLGAPPMIKNADNLTPREIAELEIINKTIPIIIRRPIPNGLEEEWHIKELDLPS